MVAKMVAKVAAWWAASAKYGEWEVQFEAVA